MNRDIRRREHSSLSGQGDPEWQDDVPRGWMLIRAHEGKKG